MDSSFPLASSDLSQARKENLFYLVISQLDEALISSCSLSGYFSFGCALSLVQCDLAEALLSYRLGVEDTCSGFWKSCSGFSWEGQGRQLSVPNLISLLPGQMTKYSGGSSIFFQGLGSISMYLKYLIKSINYAQTAKDYQESQVLSIMWLLLFSPQKKRADTFTGSSISQFTADNHRIYNTMSLIKAHLFTLLMANACALFCALYDHSQPSVKCTQTCPSGTQRVQSHCLTPTQYISNAQIFSCDGYVSADKSLCCPKQHYISGSQCFQCKGQIFNNGFSCCGNDHYLDYTQPTPNCVPLSTGPCPTLRLDSVFKVCCASGAMLDLQSNQCVQPSGYSCDSTMRVCCLSGLNVQFIEGRYQCVSQCSWASSTSSIFCVQKYCDRTNNTMRSGPSSPGNYQLMAFGINCCVGLSNGNCIKTNDSCISSLANRGWSICCMDGFFYSAVTQKCVENCDQGIVILGFVCLSNGKALDLRGNIPSEIDQFSICNGAVVSPLYPICCPPSFYIADKTGCQLCSGNIFTIQGSQICCKRNQYFDNISHRCRLCQGELDASGQLCCPSQTYVSYDTAGIASCSNSCNIGNLYQSKYCCSSLTQSCSSILFPTTCNPAYYNLNACRGCPTFCSGTSTCAVSQQAPCQSPCLSNQLLMAGVGCLECDISCQGCSRPMSNGACLSCAGNYTLAQNLCQACDENCLSCSQFTSYCTSCREDMILINNKCYKACLDPGFYFDPFKLICMKCGSSCAECSNSLNSCSSCPQKFYLSQGRCLSCDFSCSTCSGAAKICVKCAIGTKNPDSTCSEMCIGIVVRQYVNGAQCLPCHKNCLFCQGMPQNCTGCLSTTSYLDNSLGINICTQCKKPCITCSSQTVCGSCLDGFYLNENRCSQCDLSCLTCNGPSSSNCLSCFGTAQLTSSGICSGCSEGCLVCSVSTCTKCSNSYVLYQGKCLMSCPSQTYNSGETCIPCDSTCFSCNSTSCFRCANNFLYVLQDKCYNICPNNYSPSGSQCIENKQPTPPNPTPPNPTPPNPTPPNPPPNPPTNNTKTPPVTTKSGPIVDQAILIKGEQLFVNVYFNEPDVLEDLNITVNLVDKQGNVLPLSPTSRIDTSNNKVYFSAKLPSGHDLSSFTLIETKAQGKNINSTLVSAQPSNQLLLSSLTTDTLSNMKVFGYVFSVIMLIFIVLTKLKGHFSAEEANNIILHSFNFAQICYLFKYSTKQLTSGGYFFLNGFGITHLSFWPNFFSSLIPAYYVEIPYEKSLVPDGNLLRNAGYTFSYQLIVLGLTLIAVLVSVIYSRQNEKEELVHFRKIMRLGILFLQIGFMNELFFAFVQLIQPNNYQPDYKYFYDANVGCAYMLVFLVPLLMAGVIYHYYKTYNSDVLEHFYTLREASLFFYIYGQAMIMCLAVGKPLVALFLIPLQAVWFCYNFFLYKYGTGLALSAFKKYFIISGAICVSYLFLSLEEYVNWVGLVVVVSVTAIALTIYCGYQLVGIYYYKIFAEEVKDDHQS